MVLRSFSDQLLLEFNQITRLRSLNSMRLVADTLLTALSGLDRFRPIAGKDEILMLASRWLTAMGLNNESSLMSIRLSDGRECLVLNRKSCCFHYLRSDGELCASCPRQDMSIRIERMRQERDNDT